ncbi:MAG: Crp/Fnr family transcriptional regulator [Bacteroidales bacterium]|nr:Crp/Fnr family transcriptional regulator [Bacteroidales bacterium]MCF8391712.1 Crp/Fnr family transcriptional regulator [Bacteroidales bacterium]
MSNYLGFEKELSDLLSEIEPVELSSDTQILKEHSFIKEIPIVVSGSVKVYKTDESGKEIILYRILPGQSCILSIASCLNDKESKANAKIDANAKLIIVPGNLVKEWIDKYPSWRKFVHNLYYERLEEVLTLVDNIAFKQVDSRLLLKLRELQLLEGNSIKITHQELASEIATAREVVSRLLKNLEIQGKIKLERGEIRILQKL